jgi:uncharacterized protein
MSEIFYKSYKITEFSLDESENQVTIKGYGSVFGNVDFGMDVIEKGAFAKSISDKSGKFPFLRDHKYDTENLLGYADVDEDDFGLKGNYTISLDTQAGKEAYALAKMMQKAGMPLGLSIGYIPIQDKTQMDRNTGVRYLKEVKLLEITLTPFPMNEKARLTDVKSLYQQIEELKQEIAEIKSHRNQPGLPTDIDTDAELIEALTKTLKQLK